MLQFRGGSDVALLNAMMHTIVEEGLTDENYIKRFTEGFDELKTHLKDFAPEDMAEICGIDAEIIRTVAWRRSPSRGGVASAEVLISTRDRTLFGSRRMISRAT